MYQRLKMSNRSKLIVYRNMNPSYSVHSVYWWSGIPRDRRLCPCGQTQDEEHVLALCQITQHWLSWERLPFEVFFSCPFDVLLGVTYSNMLLATQWPIKRSPLLTSLSGSVWYGGLKAHWNSVRYGVELAKCFYSYLYTYMTHIWGWAPKWFVGHSGSLYCVTLQCHHFPLNGTCWYDS